MIQLHDVTIRDFRNPKSPILRSATFSFRQGARVGILASLGSGKTTLARHLSGLEAPSHGQISIIGEVSWPLGVAGFLHPHLSIAQNLTTIAKLKEVSARKYIAWCLAFCEFTTDQHLKIADLTPSERALLAYASVICLRWDFLIADETITVGQESTRMKCDAMIHQHLETSGLVFISRNPARLRQYCDQFLLLINGTLRICHDLDAGEQALALSRRTNEEILAHV